MTEPRMTPPVLVTAPSEYPTTLDEMAVRLRLIDTAADSLHVNSLIAEATDYVQSFLRRQLMQATRRVKLDTFPCGRQIVLPLPPLVSVSSIAYLDADGASQTFSSGSYTVHTDELHGVIELDWDIDWPQTYGRNLNEVTITFVCGYGAASATAAAQRAAIPASIRMVIKELVVAKFDNPGAYSAGSMQHLPFSVQQVLHNEALMEVG